MCDCGNWRACLDLGPTDFFPVYWTKRNDVVSFVVQAFLAGTGAVVIFLEAQFFEEISVHYGWWLVRRRKGS